MDTLHSSAAAEASAIASAVPCQVDEIVATNTGATVLYLHIFDSATLPADTTAPDVCIAVPATTTVSWDPERAGAADRGVAFASGCVVCLSSTAATKTIAGSVGVFTVRGY